MNEMLVRHAEHGWVDGRYPSNQPVARSRVGPVLRRHRLLIVSCTVVMVVTSAYVTLQVTPKYEASASIRIEHDAPRVGTMDRDGGPSPNELPTEIEILQSRVLAEAVAESLALQVALQVPVNVTRQEVFSVVRVSRDAPPGEYRLAFRPGGHVELRDLLTGEPVGRAKLGTPIEVRGFKATLAPGATQYQHIDFAVQSFPDAVEALERALTIERRRREADIIDVSYQATDRQLVRDVPNALAMRFIAERQSERHAEARSTAKFLREQIQKLSAKLRVSEDALRAFRERAGVVSLADEASSGVTQAAELQAKRNGIEAERVALARLIRTIQDSTPRESTNAGVAYQNLIGFPTLLHDEAMTGLLTAISAVEDRRSELLSRRSAQDPDVQNLNARATQLREQVRAMALTYLAGLGDQVTALDTALTFSRRQLGQIPEKELRLARLERDAKGFEEIVTQLQSRLKEAEIEEAVDDASVRLLDAAIAPRKAVSPKPLLNLSLALVLGLVLGTSGAVLREHLDRTVRSRNDMTIATGLPVLGVVPRARRGGWRKPLRLRAGGSRHHAVIEHGVGQTRASGQAAASTGLIRGSSALTLVEAYNLLDTNLTFARPGAPTKLLTVTSPLPGEGKTTVAVNLALTLARRGARVLLMDADLRRGAIATVFRIPQEPGVSDVLLDRAYIRKAVHSIPISDTGYLHVLARGKASDNPAQLLGSSQARSLLGALREEYDSIIVDTPPTNVVADASLIAVHSDGVIVIARAGITEAQALTFAMDQLQHVRAPVLGAVLNDIDFRRDAAYDEAYRYYARGDAYAGHTNRSVG